MLTYLNLKNFKSIKHVNLNLSKINLLIGANRSGKSSVLQSLSLLKQTKHEKNIVWAGKAVNLGSYDEVINNQSIGEEIAIQFGGQMYISPLATDITGGMLSDFGIGINIGPNGITSVGYRIRQGNFNYDGTVTRDGPKPNLGVYEAMGIRFNIHQEDYVLQPIIVSGSSGSVQGMTAEYRQRIDQTVRDITNVFQKQLDLCYLVPITRGFDAASFYLHEQIMDVSTSEGVSRQAEYAATNMAYRKEIARQITTLVKKILPDIQEISHNLLPQKRIQITSRDNFGEYNLMNEGFGLNQIVFLFYQVVTSPEGATLLIEEPEIALHPAAQSSLASSLVDLALTRNKQLLVATHSEHVLLSFLEAVTSGKLKAEDIRVYYFEKDQGISQARRLKISEKGELLDGMPGFFEVDMQHLRKFLPES